MTRSIAALSLQNISAAPSSSCGVAEERAATKQRPFSPHCKCASAQLAEGASPGTSAVARAVNFSASRHNASLGLAPNHSLTASVCSVGQTPGHEFATSKRACKALPSSHSCNAPRSEPSFAAPSTAVCREPRHRAPSEQARRAPKQAAGTRAAVCVGAWPCSLGTRCFSSAWARSQRPWSGKGSSAAYAALSTRAPSVVMVPSAGDAAPGRAAWSWHSAATRNDSSMAPRSSHNRSASDKAVTGEDSPFRNRPGLAALQRGLLPHSRLARAQSRDGDGRSITERTSTSSRIFPQRRPSERSAAAARDSRISFCGSRPGHSADTSRSLSSACLCSHTPSVSESMPSIEGPDITVLFAAGPHRESSEQCPSAATHPAGKSCSARAAGEVDERGSSRKPPPPSGEWLRRAASEVAFLESIPGHLAATRSAPVSLPKGSTASSPSRREGAAPTRTALILLPHSPSWPHACRAS
mmetsp:Transcript_33536/g.104167  ORF Transcript_33536/g.104167 Transcript_33536/m.104167 type:complete len:470 (-) Transcript_33536:744-2153(-)